MESDDELNEQLRMADRAAVAPYVEYPKDPWWAAPGFGVYCAVWAVLVGLPDGAGRAWEIATVVLMIVMVAFLGAYFGYQRRRWGAFPRGKPPREIAVAYFAWLVYFLTFMGVVWVAAEQWGLVFAVPFAFLGGTAGFWVYGLVYERAAGRLRRRVA
ncbi:hypothetical protein [Nocardioides insulae]|uniref:hypothetical protein n=1 Tax=Nocardioides insulae TaxID=394734 RepID=UPI00040F613C|nr:hypothetical protein [Nocardioides insulae]